MRLRRNILAISLILFAQVLLADTNKSATTSYDALVNAIEAYDTNLAKQLIDKIDFKDKNNYSSFRLNPLDIAIQNDQEDLVEYFINKGADVNNRTGDKNTGSTPLLTATFGNNVNMVTLLLKHGADPKMRFFSGHTALTLALKDSRRNADVISKLIEVCDVNVQTKKFPNLFKGLEQTAYVETNTALTLALRHNMSNSIIKALYQAGAKVGATDKEKIGFLKSYYYKWTKQLNNNVDAGLESTNDAVSRIGYSKNIHIQNLLVMILASTYEIHIITGKPFTETNKDLFERLASENVEAMASLTMLNIIKHAQHISQDAEFEEWKEKYQKHFNFHPYYKWSFSDLTSWANEKEPEEKARILSYIDVFSSQKARYEYRLNGIKDILEGLPPKEIEEIKNNIRKDIGIKY